MSRPGAVDISGVGDGARVGRGVVEEAELASTSVHVRFSFGTDPMPMIRVIATHLADVVRET